MGSGKLMPSAISSLSDSKASWYVKLALPVNLQLHTRLLHSIVRLKNNLKAGKNGVVRQVTHLKNKKSEMYDNRIWNLDRQNVTYS